MKNTLLQTCATVCMVCFCLVAATSGARAATAQGGQGDPLVTNMQMPHMQQGGMGKMTHGMKPARYSDNAYLSGMIAHHEAAVAMSEAALKTAKDDKVKEWAEDIIKAQKQEIATMKGLLGEAGGPDAEAARGMKLMMDGMMGKSYGKNSDENFVAMMLHHHAGAVYMAVDAVINSSNEKVVELSKNIVDDQLDEIVDFKAWLAKNK